MPRGRSPFQMSGDARCIGRGCTDSRACAGGCSWLKVDRDLRFGVCSACPGKVATFDRQRALAKGGRRG